MDGPPKRPGPDLSRGPAPVALLGMLALIAATEWTIGSRLDLDLIQPATLSWRIAREDAHSLALGANLLVLGDSLAKHGLLPTVIDPRIGGRSCNLAACAAQPTTSLVLLREALDAGARPDAIVVDFSPDLLLGEPEYNRRNWPELLNCSDLPAFARESDSIDLTIRVGLAMLLPSYRTRHELRDHLRNGVEGTSNPNRGMNTLYQKHWSTHRGGQFTPPNPAFRGEVSEAELQTLAADRFWCHSVNRRAIESFLGLAESHGIRVYWLLPPVSPALQARRDTSGAEVRHEAFVRSFQSKHPNLTILDARRAGYDWPVFQDARHLVDAGTLALSQSVADAIADGSTGWVALRAYEAPEQFENLENVHQTMMALELEDGTARR